MLDLEMRNTFAKFSKRIDIEPRYPMPPDVAGFGNYQDLIESSMGFMLMTMRCMFFGRYPISFDSFEIDKVHAILGQELNVHGYCSTTVAMSYLPTQRELGEDVVSIDDKGAVDFGTLARYCESPVTSMTRNVQRSLAIVAVKEKIHASEKDRIISLKSELLTRGIAEAEDMKKLQRSTLRVRDECAGWIPHSARRRERARIRMRKLDISNFAKCKEILKSPWTLPSQRFLARESMKKEALKRDPMTADTGLESMTSSHRGNRTSQRKSRKLRKKRRTMESSAGSCTEGDMNDMIVEVAEVTPASQEYTENFSVMVKNCALVMVDEGDGWNVLTFEQYDRAKGKRVMVFPTRESQNLHDWKSDVWLEYRDEMEWSSIGHELIPYQSEQHIKGNTQWRKLISGYTVFIVAISKHQYAKRFEA